MSHVEEVECSQVAVSHIIGPGGATIKSLKKETNTNISIVDGPKVRIDGDDEADVQAAVTKVKAILEEQANPDYEGPEGKRLRAEANAFGDARRQKMDVADQCFKDGNKDEGHTLMSEAKADGEKMHAANRDAAAAIIKNRNEGKGDDYLDLHGLRTDEALEVTNIRLDELEAKPEGTTTKLELIPGAGHHSAPGKVALKPATEDLLKKRGLDYEEATAGSFNVSVEGKGNKAAAAAATEEGKTSNDATAAKEDGAKDANEVDSKEDKTPAPTKSCCAVM